MELPWVSHSSGAIIRLLVTRDTQPPLCVEQLRCQCPNSVTRRRDVTAWSQQISVSYAIMQCHWGSKVGRCWSELVSRLRTVRRHYWCRLSYRINRARIAAAATLTVTAHCPFNGLLLSSARSRLAWLGRDSDVASTQQCGSIQYVVIQYLTSP